MDNELFRLPEGPGATATADHNLVVLSSSYQTPTVTQVEATAGGQGDCLRKPTPVKFLFGSLITVVVGSVEQKYEIHKALLCSKSGYFKKKCRDDMSMITLPYHDASAFQYFVHWLYTQSLLGYHNNGLSPATLTGIQFARVFADEVWEREDTAENSKNAHQARKEEGETLILCYPLEQLVALYIFAEEFQVCSLKDIIIETIVRTYATNVNVSTAYWTFDWGPTDEAGPVAAVNLAYEKHQGTSVIKRVLVLLYVNTVRIDCKEVRTLFNSEFLCDVLAELRGRCYRTTSGLQMDDMGFWDEEILKVTSQWGREVFEGLNTNSVKDALQIAPEGLHGNRQWFFPAMASF